MWKRLRPVGEKMPVRHKIPLEILIFLVLLVLPRGSCTLFFVYHITILLHVLFLLKIKDSARFLGKSEVSI